MMSILMIALFGLAFAFFAVQNTTPVTIQFGEFMMVDVPLYIVALGSLIAGLLIAWTFYIASMASAFLVIHGKDYEKIKNKKTMANLQQKIGELEAANARPRSEFASEPRLSLASSGERK